MAKKSGGEGDVRNLDSLEGRAGDKILLEGGSCTSLKRGWRVPTSVAKKTLGAGIRKKKYGS